MRQLLRVAIALAASSAVLLAATSASATVNPVFADGFETPVASGLYTNRSAGTTFGPWTVTAGNVDQTRPGLWTAAAGSQTVELNGTAPGAVSHSVTAQALTTYRITFALAGNPAIAGLKTGVVTVNGQQIGALSFDTTGRTPTNMGYVTQTFYFTKTLPGSAVLEFRSTTMSGPVGPVIDEVRVDSCLLVICLSAAEKTAPHIR
jgi:choice-of-anchor C domain-containing protein